jgi:hypothetical protein
MTTPTKIHLSHLERELINNKEWILTKRAVIGKIDVLFGGLQQHYQDICEEEGILLFGDKGNGAGKISKGENYQGLPWVMLDYPASFSRDRVFAVRTFFWWANFFSITLHVSGQNSDTLTDTKRLYDHLAANDLRICINEKEWDHTFDAANYAAVRNLDLPSFSRLFDRKFFKISGKIGVDEIDNAGDFLLQTFRQLLGFIRFSSPVGERVPLPGFPRAGSGL